MVERVRNHGTASPKTPTQRLSQTRGVAEGQNGSENVTPAPTPVTTAVGMTSVFGASGQAGHECFPIPLSSADRCLLIFTDFESPIWLGGEPAQSRLKCKLSVTTNIFSSRGEGGWPGEVSREGACIWKPLPWPPGPPSNLRQFHVTLHCLRLNEALSVLLCITRILSLSKKTTI